MDKACLKQEDFLHYMSILARCPKIRFIVSTDDVSACALLDDSILDAFNFIYFKVDTLSEYIDEKQYMKNLFSQKNEQEEIGIQFVLQSMVDKQRRVLQQIAKY